VHKAQMNADCETKCSDGNNSTCKRSLIDAQLGRNASLVGLYVSCMKVLCVRSGPQTFDSLSAIDELGQI